MIDLLKIARTESDGGNLFEEISFFKSSDVNLFFPVLIGGLNVPSAIFEIFPFIFLIATQFFFLVFMIKLI